MRVKNWTFILVLSVLGLFNSCTETEGPDSCGVGDPAKDLAWAKEWIQEMESAGLQQYSYLVQASFKGKPVFFMNLCCPFCKFALIVKDCQGNVVNDISSDQLSDQKIIWKPDNLVCKLD